MRQSPGPGSLDDPSLQSKKLPLPGEAVICPLTTNLPPMSYTFLIAAPHIAQRALDRLVDTGCRVLFVESAEDPAAVADILQREPVDAVIARGLLVSRQAIFSCPTLRVISKHGVGVNNIDIAAATDRDIPVFITPAVNAQSVAEHTFGLMISVARRIASYDRDLRSGKWTRQVNGIELAGRNLGIVGFGNIGQRVAGLGLAFGMRVLAYDPVVKVAPALPSIPVYIDLGVLLPQVDVLSLHCPLTPETENLIGTKQLRLLRKGAILINTARAEVIDELALVAALAEGHLAGAGLDTFVGEPAPPGPHLVGAPNVVLTPHIGGSTTRAADAMGEMAVATALNFLRGESINPTICVNPQVLRHTVVKS